MSDEKPLKPSTNRVKPEAEAAPAKTLREKLKRREMGFPFVADPQLVDKVFEYNYEPPDPDGDEPSPHDFASIGPQATPRADRKPRPAKEHRAETAHASPIASGYPGPSRAPSSRALAKEAVPPPPAAPPDSAAFREFSQAFALAIAEMRAVHLQQLTSLKERFEALREHAQSSDPAIARKLMSVTAAIAEIASAQRTAEDLLHDAEMLRPNAPDEGFTRAKSFTSTQRAKLGWLRERFPTVAAELQERLEQGSQGRG
ncbi:MAG: hypothetical protein KC609_20825 [Myxococcales bacterium]|nr:hypothetical protein [Myxococcales bacterium]